jgi:hypothetical protein
MCSSTQLAVLCLQLLLLEVLQLARGLLLPWQLWLLLVLPL